MEEAITNIRPIDAGPTDFGRTMVRVAAKLRLGVYTLISVYLILILGPFPVATAIRKNNAYFQLPEAERLKYQNLRLRRPNRPKRKKKRIRAAFQVGSGPWPALYRCLCSRYWFYWWSIFGSCRYSPLR